MWRFEQRNPMIGGPMPALRVFAMFVAVSFLYPAYPVVAQGGIFVSQHTLADKPLFYKGPMPLRFTSGGIPVPPSITIVLWYQFEDFKVEFEQGAMVEAARATDSAGRLLAELKFIDVKNPRARFREIHYGRDGGVAFECISTFLAQSPELAFKTEEASSRGRKQREYFFIIPAQ